MINGVTKVDKGAGGASAPVGSTAIAIRGSEAYAADSGSTVKAINNSRPSVWRSGQHRSSHQRQPSVRANRFGNTVIATNKSYAWTYVGDNNTAIARNSGYGPFNGGSAYSYYGSDNTAIAINDSVAGVEFQDGQVRTVINGKAK